MVKYLLTTPAEAGKRYHVMLIEVTGVPLDIPIMIWLCEDRTEYSEEKVENACINAFPTYLDVMLYDTAKYKYTWLEDEIELYIDNIELYKKMLGV